MDQFHLHIFYEGERTISHFQNEDVHRYLNIDVYKRPPTNLPSIVVMKHGRPGQGYYDQRNPSKINTLI